MRSVGCGGAQWGAPGGGLLPDRFAVGRRKRLWKLVRLGAKRMQHVEVNVRLLLAFTAASLALILICVPPEVHLAVRRSVSHRGDPGGQADVLSGTPRTLPSARRTTSAHIRKRSAEQYRSLRPGRAADDSVTLIAACKNRADAVEASLQSWRAVRGLAEIVLVDYGSDDAAEMAALVGGLSPARDAAEVFVRMTDSGAPWVLSRAYNLAASLAFGRLLVKVDCDTILAPDFLALHRVDVARPGVFYAVDWTRLHGNPLTGVFVMERLMFESAAGYDERISTYGGESVELYERLLHRHSMRPMPLNTSSCHQLAPENLAPASSEASVTGARENVLAVAALSTKWTRLTSAAMRSVFQLYERPPPGHGAWLPSRARAPLPRSSLRAVPQTWPPDALGLLSDEELNMVQAQASDEVLSKEYHVPPPVVQQMPSSDSSWLLSRLHGTGSRAVFAEVTGTRMADRIHNVARAVALCALLERPLVLFWAPLAAGDASEEDATVARVTIQDVLDLPQTNEALSAARLATQIVVGKRWPCSSPRPCGHDDPAFAHVSRAALQVDDAAGTVTLANLAHHRHLHVRFEDVASAAAASPILISSASAPPGRRATPPSPALAHAQYSAALHALALPAARQNERGTLATSGAGRIGGYCSGLAAGGEAQSRPPVRSAAAAPADILAHSKSAPGQGHPPDDRTGLAASAQADASQSIALRTTLAERTPPANYPGCTAAGDVDRLAACVQSAVADTLALLCVPGPWPGVDASPRLVSTTPGAPALRAMRRAMTR
jgi:hypothetical protein